MSTNAKFLEKDFLTNHIPRNSGSNNEQIVLEEEVVDISAPQGAEDNMDTQDPTNDVVPPQDHNNPNLFEHAPGTIVSHRSGRVIRKPFRYALLGESFDRIHEESNTEPMNYNEALQDKDAEKWIIAMKSKMESMYSNKV
ncbi:hypothetical protein KY285_027286 [Solanum tuberosum]|nr:hypothetical protein KY289_027489 [Solanum tuberosum]KAH0666080.1 hypothetical protein KY285_027286 [Solanum tuberosum]